MSELNIGKTINNLRKEKGITQDELAAHIGVSKAAVSKWETGTSYPDIILLPLLATYFNIDIDTLVGYKPQMTNEDIKKTYVRLSGKFAKKDPEEVLLECREIIKKYYSCFPLLQQFIILFVNHHMLFSNPVEILELTISLCDRIKQECGDVLLIKETTQMKGLCYILMQKPEEVIELFGNAIRPMMLEHDLLAQAYSMKQNTQKANEILQASIYQHLLALLSNSVNLLNTHIQNKEMAQEIINRMIKIIEIFEIDSLHYNTAANIYLACAQYYCTSKDNAKALDMIKKYADCSMNLSFPVKLQGDDFFDSLDGWFESIEIGEHMPRSTQVIKESIISAIKQNLFFEPLKNTPDFKSIIKKLESHLGGNQNE